jgi:hypothetical protein
MRFKWFTVLAAASALVAVSAQGADAKVTSAQLKKWEAIDTPFGKADFVWSTAIQKLSPNSTVAEVQKPCLAFVPAIKTFNKGLSKLGFTGTPGSDVAKLIKLNLAEIAVFTNIHSVKSFESDFGALDGQFMSLQAALSKDLGIPEADISL